MDLLDCLDFLLPNGRDCSTYFVSLQLARKNIRVLTNICSSSSSISVSASKESLRAQLQTYTYTALTTMRSYAGRDKMRAEKAKQAGKWEEEIYHRIAAEAAEQRVKELDKGVGQSGIDVKKVLKEYDERVASAAASAAASAEKAKVQAPPPKPKKAASLNLMGAVKTVGQAIGPKRGASL